jgi:hypothetical protein
MTDDYRTHVADLFSTNSEMLVSNSEPAHASVLLEMLLKHSKKSVSIFCRNLRSEIYDAEGVVAELIIAALNRKVPIHVVTQETPEDGHFLAVLSFLSTRGDCDIRLKVCDVDSPAAQAESNFVVVDGKSYRFEKDREHVNALACANGPVLAVKMETKFAQFERQANQTLLPAA